MVLDKSVSICRGSELLFFNNFGDPKVNLNNARKDFETGKI